MAPTEGRVGKPGRRWDCRSSTPYLVISLTQRNPVAVMHNTELTSRLKHLCVAAVTLRKHHVFFLVYSSRRIPGVNIIVLYDVSIQVNT